MSAFLEGEKSCNFGVSTGILWYTLFDKTKYFCLPYS